MSAYNTLSKLKVTDPRKVFGTAESDQGQSAAAHAGCYSLRRCGGHHHAYGVFVFEGQIGLGVDYWVETDNSVGHTK